MANSSRTQPRSAAPRGRFGRGPTSKTPASGRSLRARPGEAGPKGRFGLGSSLGPSGYGRPTSGRSGSSRNSASNVAKWSSRSRSKSQQQSGVGKALSALTAMSGGKATKKATSRSAKPAGFALLAGAAGLALKNRDKLKGLTGRGGGEERHETPTTSAYTGQTPGVQEDNRSAPSPMGTTEGTLATPPDTLTDSSTNRSQSD
jgi:hypothetical protein